MTAGMSLSSKPMAQKMILDMHRFQQIHDGKMKHETIRKLLVTQFKVLAAAQVGVLADA